MAPTVKKLRGLHIARFKKSSRTATTVVSAQSGRAPFTPAPGESPVAVLKVHILSCDNLLAKDRNGKSDPFVVASFVRQRFQTPVVKATLTPVFPEKGSVFEFPLHLSLVGNSGVLEFVVWDKDLMFKKDYLGEIALPLDEWFKDGRPVSFDDPGNKPLSINLISTRPSTPSQGTIQIKLGLVSPNTSKSLDVIYADLIKRLKDADPTLISAPPTEGIGTVRFSSDNRLVDEPASYDDGLSSDSDIDDDDDAESPPPPSPPKPLPQVEKSPKPGLLPRMFSYRKPSLTPSTSTSTSIDASSTLATPSSEAPIQAGDAGIPNVPPAKRKGPKFKRSRGEKKTDYNFSSGNDILGIVLLEVVAAEDLPKLKNMTRTGWDMDPFTVISFGKKVFRTRVIRHSLNPTWDEKLLFHVRRYETSFQIQFSILDWDKLSSNDNIGEASLDLSVLIQDAPKPDPVTGLYPESSIAAHDMKEFKLPLKTAKDAMWEKHNPLFTFRAKYQPYDALRQQFWRQYLKQYDTDDTGAFSHVEITSMLDSLGSTLSRETIDTFFIRHNKKPNTDELTFDETIQCLEAEVSRPDNEKKRLPSGSEDPSLTDTNTSAAATPGTVFDSLPNPIALEKLDFSGHTALVPRTDEPVDLVAPPKSDPTAPSGSQQPIGLNTNVPILGVNLGADDVITPRAVTSVAGIPPTKAASHLAARQGSQYSSDVEDASSGSGSGSGSSSSNTSSASFERVINIKNCPLCHRPRLNSKAEVDIITHLAVCASQDWAGVGRIVVGDFVTSSQAQRKWYTKVLSKVSTGAYQLGANSANVIVQNRMTGQLEEEKMQIYVRLGIRLLYKGAKSRMEGARARRLLKSLSIKQGVKYDAPESAREIPTFIEFHKLNMDEIRDPLTSFKTFNEFFYRKLKEDARPVTNPDDPMTLVSAADCRMMAFETVTEATKLWIKGREFSVARLLGERYKDQAAAYIGGALAIFRLAPQDYHRFHSPVDGKIGRMTYIAGEYYTVNPQAVRTTLDVYGENARKIVPIDSPCFGRVMAVCIGAMMVGSIVTTVNEGDSVARGQEFGYFAFGGSTIVLLFEPGTVQWDEDLMINGRACLETLVRVGMGVGKSLRPLA